MAAAVVSIFLTAVEYIVLEPDKFDTRPFEVLMLQWELLIASGTILLSTYFTTKSEIQGKLVPPLWGLLGAFVLIVISLGISEASWASGLDSYFRILLPDISSGATFGWSVMVARKLAEE